MSKKEIRHFVHLHHRIQLHCGRRLRRRPTYVKDCKSTYMNLYVHIFRYIYLRVQFVGESLLPTPKALPILLLLLSASVDVPVSMFSHLCRRRTSIRSKKRRVSMERLAWCISVCTCTQMFPEVRY